MTHGSREQQVEGRSGPLTGPGTDAHGNEGGLGLNRVRVPGSRGVSKVRTIKVDFQYSSVDTHSM